MKTTAIIAFSLLCLSTGMAFAEGEGPFGVPQSPNSLPPGYLVGTSQNGAETTVDQYLAQRAMQSAANTDLRIDFANTESRHASR